MESEIYDGNFSLPEYPEHADLSFSEDYTEIDGVPSGLSIDWSLLQRKIWVNAVFLCLIFISEALQRIPEPETLEQ